MREQLGIRMRGRLGDGLAAFRERLSLSARGRLGDDWDEEFGRRELRPPEQGLATLTLWRHDDEEWVIVLAHDGDPLPQEQADELRRRILDAAAQAGVTVTAQSPPDAGHSGW
ncbi:hypothetical protein [Microbispora sp. NPDC049125]|uniref:hypothetical protein n=1 Tax=Microbispora sp. NPDC049125 TaxID=3154929 RepID=UPI003467BA25